MEWKNILFVQDLFFQMKTHFMGGHTRVVGNVVNIPGDVAPTVETLPRSLSDTETIMKYKRKLKYKKCEFRENICLYAVWRAAHYLLENSNIYKNENIKLHTDWLNSMSEDSSSFVKEVEIFDPILEHLNNNHPKNIITDEYSSRETCYDVNCVVTEADTRNRNSDIPPMQCNITDENNAINIETKSSQNANIKEPSVQNVNNDNIEIGDLNEVDEDSNAIHCDTLLHEEDIPHADPESFPHELIYAPGEGRTPKSIFQDTDAEYLAFPTNFCGQKQKENKYKVNYSDGCKYELRSVDRRVAKNVLNMFF